MVKISDVAKMAGLSPSTVSRVLNNYPHVSENKKQRVLAAIKKLNYIPNSSAQKLRAQKIKTNTIALCVPSIINPFYASLVDAIDKYARDAGLQLLIYQTKGNEQKEQWCLNLLKTSQVDGIILSYSLNPEIIKQYIEYGPIIICNKESDLIEIPQVYVDNVYAGYLGTIHLIDKGYKNIAFCFDNYPGDLMKKREIGYRLALGESGLSPRIEWMFEHARTTQDGKEILNKISKMKNPPNAIITSNEHVTLGIILESKKLGLRIPKDLALIGFDIEIIAEASVPSITTINQPINEIGRSIIGLLKDQFNPSKMGPVNNIMLSSTLTIREST